MAWYLSSARARLAHAWRTFTNTDNRPHDFAGGPDPSHPECPEINVAGFVAAGQSHDTAGATFHNAPLIDYQHPHDLIMQLGGEAIRTPGRTIVALGAWLVGAPPLGPPPFMHPASASDNPQAPLGHHYLDSTHISHGVVSGGIGVAGVRLNAGVFHGREPDERRTDLDLGALDSYALQIGAHQH